MDGRDNRGKARTEMNANKQALRIGLSLAMVLLIGCPPGDTPNGGTYDQGFLDGFARNDYYWDGYFDGWDTVDDSPNYYDAGGIPYYESPPYDAGYWDGVWFAYNDGYYADYFYAFIIGFSEGYDNAYWSDYLDFLAVDQHPEFLNGGWGDGYHDGYSEGRVFGAYDYEQFLPFDWLDALLDYLSGTDLYFFEVDVGTGAYGPVVPYEYGTDPNTLKVRREILERAGKTARALRATGNTKAIDLDELELFRPLNKEAKDLLNVVYDTSLRDGIELRLTSTWLQRVNAYLNAKSTYSKSSVKRDRTPPAN